MLARDAYSDGTSFSAARTTVDGGVFAAYTTPLGQAKGRAADAFEAQIAAATSKSPFTRARARQGPST
jgi:hypothetical protein